MAKCVGLFRYLMQKKTKKPATQSNAKAAIAMRGVRLGRSGSTSLSVEMPLVVCILGSAMELRSVIATGAFSSAEPFDGSRRK